MQNLIYSNLYSTSIPFIFFNLGKLKMALTKKQILTIRQELETAKNPIYFFHDDADGLASFLLFYRFLREGKGIIVKTTPRIDSKFIRKIEEYDPDKIFVLDIAMVEQEFIDAVKRPIIWIDHHDPIERHKVKYFNPRKENKKDNIPVAALCYDVTQEDIWIGAIGAIGDWHWPKFIEKFKKQYPDLLPEKVKDPETALFETKLGKLIQILSFNLKESTSAAMRSAKILTRIKTPYEILNQETPAGRFIYKRYEKLNKEYEKELNKALKANKSGKILEYNYTHKKISFTKDIANELLHRFPKKIILIAREKSGEMKISLRSKYLNIKPILEKALQGVEGYGGGHENACGANISANDYKQFIENLKSQLE